ncbi:GDP-mannose mannosyl hydrolase [Alteromonas sp. A079]|uniref:GDP-mannose mannosyl hydrolase n=1 Tax=Alteromonas sp. A079 TaxID=3410268 RepID=UPI003BA36D88
MAFLEKQTFTTVIDSTPLVSIDLLVENTGGQVLLGYRNNRPAKGYWFVPGGRILKNETLKSAFERLTLAELGEKFDIKQATLQGPYDHIYEDSVFGDTPSTHYVAIAYRLKVEHIQNLPRDQHSRYMWLHPSDIMQRSDIHANTKAYFSANK